MLKVINVIKKKLKSKSIEIETHRKYLELCEKFASFSKCVSWKVACLIVKDNRIISSGVNGTVSGQLNCNQIFNNLKFDRKKHHEFSDMYEIHAEMNAIIHAAKTGIAIDGSIAYCNIEPCYQCLKNLSMSGVKKIIYSKKYDMVKEKDRKKRKDFLHNVGIELLYVKIN